MVDDGLSVLVTGSTSGIGAAVVRAFARRSATVLVHGHDDTGVDEVVRDVEQAGGRAVICVGDLADPATAPSLVAAMTKAAGRIDVLVNNAGTNVFGPALSVDLAHWQRAIDVDLRSAWLVARAAAPHLPDGAAVVNISSNHAFRTLPAAFPYNVAKAGVLALTRSLAVELAPRAIRVNAVCPGYIDTPNTRGYLAGFPDPDVERARVEALHPLGRLGRPDDVAGAVLFFADTTLSGFVTGTWLLIDGGRDVLLQDPA